MKIIKYDANCIGETHIDKHKIGRVIFSSGRAAIYRNVDNTDN